MHFLLSVVSVYMASSAMAQNLEALSATLDKWEAELLQQQIEMTEDAYQQSFQDSGELFPLIERELDQSVLEKRKQDRLEGFVTVQMGTALVTFVDVPLSTWFAPYVREIAELGIVSGYRDAANVPTGFFGPGDNVTVEQMAKVLVYASGNLPENCGTSPILNATASGSWSHQFIACAEKLSWALYGDGSVDVHRAATRTEVVQTLLQAFSITLNEPSGTIFTDVPATMQFSASIEQAAVDGIISGYTDTEGSLTGFFGPEDPVTRAEFAKIITLGLQVYGSQEQSG